MKNNQGLQYNQKSKKVRQQSLGEKASTGVIWTTVSRYTNWILNISIGVVLSRLLTPSDFGILTLALVFSNFLAVFSDAGARSAVIQFRDIDEANCSSAFWLSLILGGLCALCMIAISPFASIFSRQNNLQPVIAIISIGFIGVAAGAVPAGILQRRMDFKKIASCEITSGLISNGIALFLAFHKAGYWSLVIQNLLFQLINGFLLFVAAQWWPRYEIKIFIWKRILSYSGKILLYNGINYWARNIDSLLVGRLFGSRALGYYNRASTIMLYPVSMLHSTISPVLHPALSTLQNDPPKMYDIYKKILKFMATVSIPVSINLWILSSSAVYALWGKQWEQSIRLLQILCIVAAIQPLHLASGGAFLAKSRSDLYFKAGLIYTAGICIGVIAGSHWGVMGVAIGYSSSYLIVFFPIMFLIFNKVFKARFGDFLKIAKTPLIVGLGTGMMTLLWNLIDPWRQPPIHFAIGTIIAGLTYMFILYKVDLSLLRSLLLLLPYKIQLAISRNIHIKNLLFESSE